MPQLKAIRPLSGKYGHVHPGDFFTCDEDTALALESRGLAYRYRPPSAPIPVPASFMPGYATKIMPPAKQASKK